MVDSAAQTNVFYDFGPVDGVHELRQRTKTTLWYRSIQPETIQLTQRIAAAPLDRADLQIEEVPFAIPAADQLADIAQFAIAAGKRAEAQSEPAKPAVEPIAQPAWLVVPATCPALMLSESPTLSGQVASVHLTPGVQFRVASVANGVAEVEVLGDEGEIVNGYCNTVDLACADPDGASARSSSGKTRATKPSRFKIPNLTPSFRGSR